MPGQIHAAAVVLASGLMILQPVRAERETTSSGRAGPPSELCEAFPWDVPVEQSFTVEGIARWRRLFRDTQVAGWKRSGRPPVAGMR